MLSLPHRWIGAHAAARPHQAALHDLGTGTQWTWAALHRRVGQWSTRLRQEGLLPGDRVAVLAPNRAETLALLGACAELGTVLFPMNWRLSAAELRWQLGHCTPSVVFAAPEFQALDLGHPTQDLHPATQADGQTGPGAAADQAWMLMYTSGSTGRPKGALLTHGQVRANAQQTIDACALSPASSTLCFAPLFHTGGMNCLGTPLLAAGGQVFLTPALDPGAALATIAQQGITHLMGVPTIYQLLAENPAFGHTDLSSLQDALCGGAPLPAPLLRRYLDRGLPLRQGFGLTEVGPNCFSLAHREVGPRLLDGPSVGGALPSTCVGRPIAPLQAKLVRADGQHCGPGEPGELCLKGAAVFGGYWADPAATQAALRDGWFHTGDVLVADAEGCFYVRGRIKEMYISGGENVYPAEVEQVLCQAPGVAAAAVVSVPDARWGEVGRAFVQAEAEHALDAAAIHHFLQDRLARYKQPKRVVVLPSLPRTGSGKIDKPALSRLEV